MTLTEAAPAGRLRAAWNAAHAPVTGVSRWARIAAYTVPFAVLPSGVWRIVTVVFLRIGSDPRAAGDLPWWLPIQAYVILLSIISELLAFAAVGLIARWGEVFPRWIPGLRGCRVPVLAAVIPAGLGAAVLTFLWTVVGINAALGRDLQGRPLSSDALLLFDGWSGVLAVVSYAPLLLWGPLLGFLTVAYWRRRRASTPRR